MMNHEYLMKSTNGPLEPWSLEVYSLGVAADKVLRQDHDEPLEDDEEQVLLVRLGSL